MVFHYIAFSRVFALYRDLVFRADFDCVFWPGKFKRKRDTAYIPLYAGRSYQDSIAHLRVLMSDYSMLYSNADVLYSNADYSNSTLMLITLLYITLYSGLL